MKIFYKKAVYQKIISGICLLLTVFSNVPYILAQENITSASASALAPDVSPTIIQASTPSAVEAVSVSTPSSILSPLMFEATQAPTPEIGISPTFTPTLSPAVSARLRTPANLRKLSRRDYQNREPVTLNLDNALASEVTAEVVDNKGNNIPVRLDKQTVGDGVVLHITPPIQFRPGRYRVRIQDATGTIHEQDFTWGVLAVNTNKSIYLPGETANIAIAVLDDAGRMVCNAKVNLKISAPNGGKEQILSTSDGSIVVNKACTTHGVTSEPDYEADYVVGAAGVYQMTLTAQTVNGDHSISDAFAVRNSVSFDVERITATRIYPKSDYDVIFKIKANQDFSGRIVEEVPSSFGLSQAGGPPFTRITADAEHISLAKPYAGDHPVNLGFGAVIEDPGVKKIYDNYGLAGHDGIDFDLAAGTPVLAADAGLVVRAGPGDYGETLVIEHSWGRSYYGHLSQILVEVGRQVAKGENIALSGNTGLTTGAHLHFGIKLNQNDIRNGYFGKIDPAVYLGEKGSTPVYESQKFFWDVQLRSGQELQLAYRYDAPDESPQFYLLGPLQFINNEKNVVFTEARRWQIASDATFSMQTGYYLGTGSDNLAITGVGFSPDFMMIKDDTAGGTDGVAFKTTSMSGEVSSVLSDADADTATNAIQSLDSDGFTLGTDADVNTANVRYTWIAFDGSDCTSSGTFCVGSYTGDGNTTKAITAVGFQPDLVVIKRSGATAGVWRSSTMSTNVANFFHAAAENTGGTYFTTLDATGFTVGNNAAVNTNANTYYYIAFKKVTNVLDVGSYTGNSTDSRNITTPGFAPDLAWVKLGNDTSVVPAQQAAVYNVTENFGDSSSSFLDAANATDRIQSMISTGFQVGANLQVNGTGGTPNNTYYWVVFAGAPDPTASGTFNMDNGSYTGTGSSFSVTGLGFAPDLVIIKQESDGTTENYAVWKSRLVNGDNTVYFANAANFFAGGITALGSDGFTVGTNATVNTNAKNYQWTAFGNAFSPTTNSGAADFAVGVFHGNALDSRDITRVPFQPSLVAIDCNGGNRVDVWRSSAQSGDLSGYFNAAAEAADLVQTLNADGFQVGAASDANRSATNCYWFAFKEGTNFDVGTYSGTGSAQDITSAGFQPDLVWSKITSSAQSGAHRPSSLAGDSTQSFINAANFTGGITGFVSSGFSLGTSAVTNTSGANNYRYSAWKIPSSATATLDQLMRHGGWFSAGSEQPFTF